MNTKIPRSCWGFVAIITTKVLGVGAQITLSEIAGHGTETDCWTAVYGEVYDVTGYVPTHPAGTVILVSGMCGKDGTTDFDQFHGDTPNYMSIFPGITRLGTLAVETPAPTDAPMTPQPTPSPTDAPMTPQPTPSPTDGPVSTTPSPTDGPVSSTPMPTTATPLTTPSPTTAAPFTTTPAPVMGVTSAPAPSTVMPTCDSCSSSDSDDSDDRKMLRG